VNSCAVARWYAESVVFWFYRVRNARDRSRPLVEEAAGDGAASKNFAAAAEAACAEEQKDQIVTSLFLLVNGEVLLRLFKLSMGPSVKTSAAP
jgi:hypothetical protein